MSPGCSYIVNAAAEVQITLFGQGMLFIAVAVGFGHLIGSAERLCSGWEFGGQYKATGATLSGLSFIQIPIRFLLDRWTDSCGCQRSSRQANEGLGTMDG